MKEGNVSNCSLVIVQTHVEAYRLPVYEELYRRLGERVEVWSGGRSFAKMVDVPARRYAWHKELNTTFLLGYRLAWQTGHILASMRADVCVLESNPRILSTWTVVVLRRLFGRRSVLWGHVLPRGGASSRTKFIRKLLLRAAGAVNLYTHKEAKVLSAELPGIRSHVAANAVMMEAECRVAAGTRWRLLFVARMVPEKKPFLMLEAFEMAAGHMDQNVVLDFFGDGPLLEELCKRVSRSPLRSRIAVHGAVYRTQDLAPFYHEALAAFSPGYVGLSAIQAFGFGVPIILGRSEPHSVEIELCEVGVNCECFESDSASALSDEIIKCNVGRWTLEAREAIAQRVRTSYTIERMCDGFMQWLTQEREGGVCAKR